MFSCWVGECKNGECKCPDGFIGDYCENRGTTCDMIHCGNYGVCIQGYCKCEFPYSGQYCQYQGSNAKWTNLSSIFPLLVILLFLYE